MAKKIKYEKDDEQTIEQDGMRNNEVGQDVEKMPPQDGTDQVEILDKVGVKEIEAARLILEKYKKEKAARDEIIVENQEWWKKRWSSKLDTGDGKERFKPKSSWLHSCIDNKVADYMDNYPEPNILPKEPDDEMTAKTLTSIVPVILEQNGFKKQYRKGCHSKVLNGTACYLVTWNANLHNGLGDVEVRVIDLLNVFFENGITDIQKSPHLFTVEMVDNKQLELDYPELEGKLGGNSFTKTEYRHDESLDTSDKSYVIDWYYKANVNGKDILHYCKFVDNYILYSTENDPELTDVGLYADGKYPIVMDVLFPVPDSPTGYGYVDLNKDAQMYIDKMEQACLENVIVQATPRWLINDGADIDETEFADIGRHVIKAGGSLGSDAIMPVSVNSISGNNLEMYMHKIDEMKETSGNKDVTTGSTSSGVTAASAISAMQEAGSKTARWQIDGTYDAYKDIILMVIERVRQNYDLPRVFRIIGSEGAMEFVEFSNEKMQAEVTGLDLSDGTKYERLPMYDVEVSASKSSPYSKLANNEMFIQLYQLGVFAPDNSDMALALLECMDFNHKDKVISKVKQNGTMYDTIMQLQQALVTANAVISELTGQDLMTGMPVGVVDDGRGVEATPGAVDASSSAFSNNLGSTTDYEGNSLNAKARKKVAESTSPV